MLNIYKFCRTFHTSHIRLGTNKSLLGKLRKKTGYTFANCKKALEVSNNDLEKAEQWLKEQALALGWAKAAKLAGRSTLQGLIAVTNNETAAAMVEINCETDFVAKNDLFQEIVIDVANSCLNFAKTQQNFQQSIAKVYLDNEQLKNLKNAKGKVFSDEIALLMSQVGENVSLRRAACFNVCDGLFVAGHTHPTFLKSPSIFLGKYGALLVYKPSNTEPRTFNIAKQLCQHIIGMKPATIGDIEKDLPKENKEEETCMIHQEFLLEPDTPVMQVLLESGISLIEFLRFECGEDIEKDEDSEDVKIVAESVE